MIGGELIVEDGKKPSPGVKLSPATDNSRKGYIHD